MQVFLAGGVPEVMLHLRRAGLLETGVLTVSGEKLGRDARLVGAIRTPRRACGSVLRERDGIDPDDVIMDPDGARRRGLTSTVTFPKGNLAPGGSVIKSTAIDPSVVDADGVYRKTGPARVFLTEKAAIAAIKSGPERIQPGDVMVLMCRGPHGFRDGGDLRRSPSALKLPGFRQARRRDHRRPFQRRFHRRLHRPRHARSAGRRADRQGAGRRPDRDRHRPRAARRLRQSGSEWQRAKKARASWPHAPRARDLAPDPDLPPKPACGRLKTSAAAPGAGAFSTWTRS